MKTRDILILLHIKHKGDFNSIFEDIQNKVAINEEELKGVDTSEFITIVDEDYPKELRTSFRPPFVYKRNQDIVNMCGKIITRKKALEKLNKKINELKEEIMNENDCEEIIDACDCLCSLVEEKNKIVLGSHVLELMIK